MQLNYKKFGEGFPLVILHGLLGSLDNWQTIAKKLAEKFEVFIVDQRNHGRSPHSDEFYYGLLANDLFEFFEQHRIKQAHLVGHSMGGKTAMKFAMEHPEKVVKLIVVDVVPAAYEDGHNEVFSALFAANVRKATSREEVEKSLREKLNGDKTTVQFLLKGLQRAETGEPGFRWKFNLESLHKNYQHISESVHSSKPFTGETLFIKGEKSSYINSGNYTSVQQLFPNHQLNEIKNAGHWVHAEKPAEFMAEVMRFLT